MRAFLNFFRQKIFNRRTFFIALAICGIVVGLFLYIMHTMKGAPFDAAKQYIYRSQHSINELGRIRSVRLDLCASAFEYSGAFGKAQYKMNVDGDKKSGVVYIDMEKHAGEWVVIRAKLFLPDSSVLNLEEADR